MHDEHRAPDRGTNDLLFREEQRLRTWWLWLIVGGVCVFVLGAVVVGVIQAILADGNWAMALVLVPILLFDGLILGLMWGARLRTEVRHGGLFVQLFPLHFSPIGVDLSNVTDCEAVTYHPLREYGGWGIRCGLRGKSKAYNMNGNRGVRLRFSDGSNLLIGSERPEELAAAIGTLTMGRF